MLLDEVSNDPIKKAKLIKDIIQTLALIPDPIKRSLYVKECSRLLDVEEKIVVRETNNARLLKKQKDKKQAEREQRQAEREAQRQALNNLNDIIPSPPPLPDDYLPTPDELAEADAAAELIALNLGIDLETTEPGVKQQVIEKESQAAIPKTKVTYEICERAIIEVLLNYGKNEIEEDIPLAAFYY